MTVVSSSVASPVMPVLSGARPVLGHLLEMRRDSLRLFERGMRESDDVCVVRLPGRDMVLVNQPELIWELLVDKASAFEKGVFGEAIEPLVGAGLLTADNAPHRRNRKLVAPAFHHQRIAGYFDAMSQYALESTSAWRDGAIIDVHDEMMRLTLRIVAKTLFDADVASDASVVGEALAYATEFLTRRQQNPLSPPLTWPLPSHLRFRDAVARLDRVLLDVIVERHASDVDRGDLLSMLLATRDEDDGSRLSDVEVRDEAMTIFLAGHETTANALTWVTYLLARSPQIWLKLREEVVSALGDRMPTLADLKALPYALQIFKEGLRLYPPAYVFGRMAVRDVTLGRFQIRAGTVLGVCPYSLHRDARYWTQPDRFDPDRFSPEREAKTPRYAYLPFGGGPRVCIGNQFALMEGQLIVALMAQRAKLDLIHTHVEPEPLVTLRPKHGLAAKVTRL